MSSAQAAFDRRARLLGIVPERAKDETRATSVALQQLAAVTAENEGLRLEVDRLTGESLRRAPPESEHLRKLAQAIERMQTAVDGLRNAPASANESLHSELAALREEVRALQPAQPSAFDASSFLPTGAVKALTAPAGATALSVGAEFDVRVTGRDGADRVRSLKIVKVA